MAEINIKLPEIDEKACNYAVLEYELNQILKELGFNTEITENDDKTLDYMYRMMNKIHFKVKIQAMEIKKLNLDLHNAERRASLYKEDLEILESKMDASDTLSSWEGSIDSHEFTAHNLDFRPTIHESYDRKVSAIKETPAEISSMLRLDEMPEMPVLPSFDQLSQRSMYSDTEQQMPKKQNNKKISFYPMSFIYSDNPITQKYFKHLKYRPSFNP